MTRILPSILILIFFLASCNSSDKEVEDQQYLVLKDSLDQWLANAKMPGATYNYSLNELSRVSTTIDTISVDSIKLKYLAKLSLAYFKKRDTINFLGTNKGLETYAIKLKDSVKLAEAYWDKGVYFNLDLVSIRDSAYFYLSRAQKIYELLGLDLENASVLREMAAIQTSIHDNTGAHVTLTKSLQLLKPLDNKELLYRVSNTMGIASFALYEYDEALNYYEQARQYLNKTDLDDTNYAGIDNNVGFVYFKMGDYHKAKSEYTTAINRDSLFLKKPKSYARLLDHIAMTNLKLGETANVENDLYRALYIRDSIGDLEGLSLNYYNLAQFFKESGNKSDAYVYANNAKDLSRDIDNNLRYLESLKLLAELDPENANAYNTEYILISDSLQQEERRIRNKFNRIQFETEETLAENQQLSRQRVFWIGISLGVLLLAVALIIIISQRIKNEKLRFQQQQQESNQEIFNLMLSQKQKLEEGKQTEQKRISEELHDGILGEMNGVRMILLGLNKKNDDQAISLREQAIEKLKDVQEEIRTISHELNDASYQKFSNFTSSIEELLANICSPAGLTYSFNYDEDLEWDNLEGIIKINLYRIIQESLQNCVKHAEATKITVDFASNEKEILVSIKDNGRGFEVSKGKKGIGHKNIKSRIEKINGQWSLQSASGKGTSIQLAIPLEHISQDAKKEIPLLKKLRKV